MEILHPGVLIIDGECFQKCFFLELHHSNIYNSSILHISTFSWDTLFFFFWKHTGDGMHGIRGKSIDEGNKGGLVSHEDKMEKKLHKSNYVHDPTDKTHGSKAAHNLDSKLHHGGKHDHKHDKGHEKHLSMHERAALAVQDKKAHGTLVLHHDSHHHAHHGKTGPHDHSDHSGDGNGDGDKHHHHHHKKKGAHSREGRH